MSSHNESSDEELEIVLCTILHWTQNTTLVCAKEWREVKNDRPLSGIEWILNILDGHAERCYDSYRMSITNFSILCDILRNEGLVCNGDVIIEEQVAMFLEIVGQGHTMRTVGEVFQHSVETVWRCFRNVLSHVIGLYSEYINLPNENTPRHSKVAEGTLHAPFKDALGAIDGTHILAYPDKEDEFPERYRNRKGFNSQNVMAAVDFDGYYVAVVTGWEGSTHDNLILQIAVEDGFVVPPGRYYLVDGGYSNTKEFLSPYRGRRYHLAQFRNGQRHYECLEDLFNHRHSQLRNTVEKTFGITKGRFKILVYMRKYKFKIQKNIVRACCILHNFIKHQNKLQNTSDESLFEEHNDTAHGDEHATDVGVGDTQSGHELRENIKNILWNNR